jgi:hypothetical protein
MVNLSLASKNKPLKVKNKPSDQISQIWYTPQKSYISTTLLNYCIISTLYKILLRLTQTTLAYPVQMRRSNFYADFSNVGIFSDPEKVAALA